MHLVEIKAKNLFSWENLCICFSPSGTYSFKGDNGSGKSSIWEILTWVLFKKTIKKNVKGNYGEVEGEGQVTLSDGKNFWVIERNTKNPATVISSGKEITQEQLEQILGCNYAIFCSSVMCNQKRVSSFINESSDSGKAKIFGEMIGCSILDDMRKKCGDKRNSKEVEFESLKSKLEVYKENLENIKLSFGDESPKEYALKIKKLKLKIPQLETDADNAYKEFDSSIEIMTEWAKYTEKKSSIKRSEDDLDIKNKKLLSLKNKLPDKFDEEKIKNIIKDLNDNLDIISKRRSVIEGQKYSEEKQIIKLNNSLKLGGKCPTCGSKITEKHKTELKKDMKAVRSLLDSLDKERNVLLTKNEDLENRLNSAVNKLDTYSGILNSINTAEIALQTAETTLKYLKKEFKKPEKPVPNINIIKNKMEEASDKLWKYKNAIEKRTELIKNYKLSKEKINVCKSEYNDKAKEYEIVKWIWDNLPLMKLRYINNNKIQVEDLINKYIAEMGLSFIVRIDTQKTKTDKTIKDVFTFKIFNDRNNEVHKNDLSGGEETCILIATQFAINEVSNMPLDFEIYDEIYGSLDSQHISTVIGALQNRSEKNQIFSISHKDEISNSFGNIITVERVEGKSYVR